MKRLFLVILLFVSIAISTLANTTLDNKSKINFLKQHYSTALVLQAVDQVLEHDGFSLVIIPKGEGDDYYDYQQRAEKMVMGHPNVLDAAFSNVVRKKENPEILDHVMIWCDVFATLSQLPRLSTSIYLEQVLAEIPSSKVIIDSFLPADGQTWNSLSSSQLTMLPYVAANFLYKKSERERLQFNKDFHAKVLELTTSEED